MQAGRVLTISQGEATVEELLRLVEERAEWRLRFRRALLGEVTVSFQEVIETLQQVAQMQRQGEERTSRLEAALSVLAEAQQRTAEAVLALAEAQRRTEERVEALVEAQRRTEERLEALAEAQQRTEERVGRLEAAVEALAEAQRRTEERLEALAEAQRHLEERVGRLEAAVEALAEAQRRTEERLEALAEAQRRTEERLAHLEAVVQNLVETARQHEERLARLEAIVESLVEAQRRTEERLERLETIVESLVEAQRRTEERVDHLSLQLGQLSNRLGLDLEVDAEEVLMSLLEERGIRPLQEPFAIELDGEMDVVVPVELSTGEHSWIIVEVKGRLRRKELGKFLQRLQQPWFQERLQQEGIQKPYLPYVFGLRVYAEVDQMAREAGVGVLSFRGERVAPRLWE